MEPTNTILEKLSAPLARVGEGLAAGAALVAQAVPHVTRFGAEQMVNFAFYPQRSEDPQQWEWFPQKHEAFEVVADDGAIFQHRFSDKVGESWEMNCRP